MLASIFGPLQEISALWIIAIIGIWAIASLTSSVLCYRKARKNVFASSELWAFWGFIVPFIPLFFIRSTDQMLKSKGLIN